MTADSREDLRRTEDLTTHELVVKMYDTLASHIEQEPVTMKRAIDDVVRSLVPDGDAAGHKSHHQALIDATKAQEAFYRDLKSDVAKKGFWFILKVVAGLFVLGLLTKTGGQIDLTKIIGGPTP